MSVKKKLYPLIPTVLVILILYLVSRSIDPNLVKEWVRSAGFFGPLLVVALGVVTTVIAPLSGTPILFVGFALYGEKIIFLSTISMLISAAINFYISRRWGRPFIQRFVGRDNMQIVDKFTKEHGVVSLLLIRIFMGSVNDFVSYAMGLTNMKFKTYYIVTLLGSIPGLFLWYFVAINSHSPLAFTIYTAIMVGAFTLVFAVGKLAERLVKKNNIR